MDDCNVAIPPENALDMDATVKMLQDAGCEGWGFNLAALKTSRALT